LEEKGLKLSCHFCLEDEAVLHSSSSQPSTEDLDDVDMDLISISQVIVHFSNNPAKFLHYNLEILSYILFFLTEVTFLTFL
jgi:hypothetical protein